MKQKYLEIIKDSSEEFLEQNLIYELSKNEDFLRLIFNRIESQVLDLKSTKKEAIRVCDKLLNDRLKHGLSGEFSKKTSNLILQMGFNELKKFLKDHETQTIGSVSDSEYRGE